MFVLAPQEHRADQRAAVVERGVELVGEGGGPARAHQQPRPLGLRQRLEGGRRRPSPSWRSSPTRQRSEGCSVTLASNAAASSSSSRSPRTVHDTTARLFCAT
ncbi:hypothetical protein ACFQ2B_04450 [Streptomyces stramineus]